MASRAAEVERVTVSLPRRLVRYADLRAAEMGTSRSQIIGRALSELEMRERDDLAKQGYAFYAAESEAFAAETLTAVSEALASGG